MELHTYVVQYAHTNGNGWAIMSCPSPSYIEGSFRSQTRFADARITSFKEVEYFGNETSLICEGSITTYAKTPYDIAVWNGFVGTEQEWLESLKGENALINGMPAITIEAGDNITIEQEGDRFIIKAIGSVASYDGLYNKPSIEGEVLEGNKSASAFGLAKISDIQTVPEISTNISDDASSDIKTASPKAVKEYVDAHSGGGGGGSITIDTELSDTSTNPVQNKVIKEALDEKADISDIPTVPTNVSAFNNDAGYLTSHQDISGKADKATTLAGYGITDAKIESGVITLGSNTITPLTSHQSLTDYVQKSQTAGLLKNDGTIDTTQYLTSHQSLSGYAKYVLCADEAAYNAISPKQSDTLYLIPES